MLRRRKKSTPTAAALTPAAQPAEAAPQCLTPTALHLMEPFLSVLVQAGVQEFHGYGVHVRLGPRPVVERRIPVPVPVHPGGQPAPMPGPTSPLTPQAREAVLSRLEDNGVDEGDPLFDAVRRSSP